MDTADLYLRLSLDFEGATAIERQEAECRRWCAAHGLTVRAVHVDRGVSGFATTVHRDGFDSASRAVTSGETSTLVVWKLDRLSRRGVGQVGQLLDAFERVGGRLVSVADQLDTAQPQARMIIALLSEFARAESETMGMRIKSAKEAARARGEWLSGKPPIGYAVAPDKRLVPVEPAASAVRTVFTMLAAGKTLLQACVYLNDAGIPNSRGNRWTDSALSEALRTCAYAGLQPERHVTAEGRHAPGKHKVYRNRDTGMEVSCLTPGANPIVPRALQLEAFDAMTARLRQYGPYHRPGQRNQSMLVRGLGRCGSCGRALVNFGGSYKCRRSDRDGTIACTAPVSAKRDVVDAVVADLWIDLVATDTSVARDLRQAVSLTWEPPQKSAKRWSTLHAELVDLRTRLADADIARFVRGDLDEQRHHNVVDSLTRRIDLLEGVERRTDLRVDTRALNDADQVRTRFLAEESEGQRRLLRLAFTRIDVAKAATRGGRFDRGRITFERTPRPTDQLTWLVT